MYLLTVSALRTGLPGMLGFEATYPSQFLALMDPSDQSLGRQLARPRHPRIPRILLSAETVLAV